MEKKVDQKTKARIVSAIRALNTAICCLDTIEDDMADDLLGKVNVLENKYHITIQDKKEY